MSGDRIRITLHPTCKWPGCGGKEWLRVGPSSVDGKVEVTQIGLVFHERASFAEWSSIGAVLSRCERVVQWAVGDWLAYGEQQAWGEKYDRAIEATGLAYQTVANCKWVAQSVDFSRRREKLTWRHHAEVAKLEPEGQAKWLEKAETEGWTVAELRKAMRPVHVSRATGDNEWYTPPEHIEAARRVMGGIDCDPASSETANETVDAETFYTKEDDGLTRVWGKRVWMNPPYAQPLVTEFVGALVERLESNEVEQACVLVNNATETGWFQHMLAASSAVCFPKGRVRFLSPDGNTGTPLQGQAILYMGKRPKAFCKAFCKMGEVLLR